MNNFIDKDTEPFPSDRDFLVAWVSVGEIDTIEWYTKIPDEFCEDATISFWNLNSSNQNDFKLDDYDGPTHWAELPKLTKEGE